MHRPPVIGVSGLARTGKDTVANFALAQIGGYRYSFADPMRDMLKAIGMDLSDPFWQDRKDTPIPALGASPRRLMQTLGTEWGRQLINPDIWLVLAKQRLLAFGPGMIISDVRFENEANWVRSLGGLVIHLVRPSAPKIEQHISEAGVLVNDLDLVIHNNGTLEQLFDRVKETLDGFSQTGKQVHSGG
jgi:hypothetical protein